MKARERSKARNLRLRGFSIREIAQKIQCAKSSVSGWVRDIPLSAEQIKRLKSNQDKGREKAANHPNSSRLRWLRIREETAEAAKKEVPPRCSLGTLKLLGAALYWAEGYSATRNTFVFANCDPRMIKVMMRFLINVCKIPIHRIRGRVNIHPRLDVATASKYWAGITRIPLRQFHKPLLSVSKASKHKRRTLPYGTFRIVVSDVILCSKIKGWINALAGWGDSWALGSAG